MASLYVTSNNARKVAVGILGVFLVIILIDTFIRVTNTIGQAPTAARRFYLDADKGLGNVGIPNIPAIELDNKNIPFSQESIHPKFPDVSYVYSIEQPSEKSNTFERATRTATALGFTAQNLRDLGNNDFRWTLTDQSKTLNFNKLTQIWSMGTIYENNTDAKKKKTMLTNITGYTGKVPTILNALVFSTGLGLNPSQIDARYLIRTEQGDIKETQDYRSANYVALNVFRKITQADLKPSGEQPRLESGETRPQATTGVVYTSDPRKGEFTAIVSNGASNLSTDMFEMTFTNFEYGKAGVYFTITPEEAFTKIQQGQGSLVALSAENTDYFEPYVKLNVRRFVVDARRTGLGFYEPSEWTGFAYPIYILSGRAELEEGGFARFTFFVDAIKRS